MKIVNILIAGLLILCLSLPVSKAEVSEGVMAELFNGLADIIERNMSNPTQAIAQLTQFIAANKTSFMEWKRTVEENMEKAMANPQQMPSQQDWQKMQQEMSQSKGAEAMNRWTQSIMNFMMRNPEIGERVQGIMEDISPNFDSINNYR
jgi:glutamyl-tRNA reductase